eukprot:760226-Hanusia_phi.AAC.8
MARRFSRARESEIQVQGGTSSPAPPLLTSNSIKWRRRRQDWPKSATARSSSSWRRLPRASGKLPHVWRAR